MDGTLPDDNQRTDLYVYWLYKRGAGTRWDDGGTPAARASIDAEALRGSSRWSMRSRQSSRDCSIRLSTPAATERYAIRDGSVLGILEFGNDTNGNKYWVSQVPSLGGQRSLQRLRKWEHFTTSPYALSRSLVAGPDQLGHAEDDCGTDRESGRNQAA